MVDFFFRPIDREISDKAHEWFIRLEGNVSDIRLFKDHEEKFTNDGPL